MLLLLLLSSSQQVDRYPSRRTLCRIFWIFGILPRLRDQLRLYRLFDHRFYFDHGRYVMKDIL